MCLKPKWIWYCCGTNRDALISFELEKKRIIVSDQSSKDLLKKGNFGYEKDKELMLYPEEALYLLDVRNAECTSSGKKITFSEMAQLFSNEKRLLTKFFAYKDWRDRGLTVKMPDFECIQADKTSIKKYPSSSLQLSGHKASGNFYPNDLLSIVEGEKEGKALYENFWFGQYGSYKAADRGILNKLDIYETIFLIENKALKIKGFGRNDVMSFALNRRKYFAKLYSVYSDWRKKGYVIKTGFKFGTHFRIYFPGARPVNEGNTWVHSKHVLHIFPKEDKLIISEWARAIRVAHSVRKTFILAIPGRQSKKKMEIDYILYHRRGGEAENPKDNPPKYAMLALNEENYIGGKELASALEEAKSRRLELVVAIVDRETAVTYYKVRQIELHGSSNDYYEIDWMQP